MQNNFRKNIDRLYVKLGDGILKKNSSISKMLHEIKEKVIMQITRVFLMSPTEFRKRKEGSNYTIGKEDTDLSKIRGGLEFNLAFHSIAALYETLLIIRELYQGDKDTLYLRWGILLFNSILSLLQLYNLGRIEKVRQYKKKKMKAKKTPTNFDSGKTQ